MTDPDYPRSSVEPERRPAAEATNRPGQDPRDRTARGLAGESQAETEATAPVGHGAVEAGPTRRARLRGFGVVFWLALVWLGLVMFAALFAGVLPVPNPNQPNYTARLLRPFEGGTFLGTDGLGRDIFSRLVHGARVSVVISVSAVGIGMAGGATLGMFIGFVRGRIEQAVVAVIDIILAFPGLIILLALIAYVGQSLTVIALTIGVLSIPIYTRISRANTLAVSNREFVLAAEAMGATRGRILLREIFPNVVLPVLAFGLIAMGVVIVLEGALAFLGLSVELPRATWGSMISEGRRYLHETYHLTLIPSGVMFLTVLSLNFMGDVLRSRFDVRESAL